MRLRIAAAGMVLAAATTAGVVTALPAEASGQYNGCAYGDVCMYTLDGWHNGTPQHHWTSYGYHALYNEWGTRVILDNQYPTLAGNPASYVCTAQRASTCERILGTGPGVDPAGAEERTYQYGNIDSINYIRLTPSGGQNHGLGTVA